MRARALCNIRFLLGDWTVDKKPFSPRRGRIALSANERIAEFLDFAIQAKFAYVGKLRNPRRSRRGFFRL